MAKPTDDEAQAIAEHQRDQALKIHEALGPWDDDMILYALGQMIYTLNCRQTFGASNSYKRWVESQLAPAMRSSLTHLVKLFKEAKGGN